MYRTSHAPGPAAPGRPRLGALARSATQCLCIALAHPKRAGQVLAVDGVAGRQTAGHGGGGWASVGVRKLHLQRVAQHGAAVQYRDGCMRLSHRAKAHKPIAVGRRKGAGRDACAGATACTGSRRPASLAPARRSLSALLRQRLTPCCAWSRCAAQGGWRSACRADQKRQQSPLPTMLAAARAQRGWDEPPSWQRLPLPG